MITSPWYCCTSKFHWSKNLGNYVSNISKAAWEKNVSWHLQQIALGTMKFNRLMKLFRFKLSQLSSDAIRLRTPAVQNSTQCSHFKMLVISQHCKTQRYQGLYLWTNMRGKYQLGSKFKQSFIKLLQVLDSFCGLDVTILNMHLCEQTCHVLKLKIHTSVVSSSLPN